MHTSATSTPTRMVVVLILRAGASIFNKFQSSS